MPIKEYVYLSKPVIELQSHQNLEMLWEEINNAPPEIVMLETISDCNRKCTYCSNHKYRRPHHIMEEYIFKSIIDQLSEWGFHGNIGPTFYSEPLLDDRLLKWFSYARLKLPNAQMSLATNGDLLTAEFAAVLLENAFTNIRITQHDHDFRREAEFEDFDLRYQHLKDRLTILRPNWTPHNLGGHMSGQICQPNLKKQCLRYSHLTIDCYGHTALCCNDYFAQYSSGSVHANYLREIWLNSESIRRDLYLGNHMKYEICQRCVGYTL